MPIRLKIGRSPAISLEEEVITLGSDPMCVIPLPASNGLSPRHAVIRKIAGRWIVEAREAESIRVGDGEPTRLHWLSPDDVILLCDGAPQITFEPQGADIGSSPAPRPAGTQPTTYSTSSLVRPTLRFEANSTPASPVSGSPTPGTSAPLTPARADSGPPISEDEPDTLQLSKPRQVVTPPFENPVELSDLKPPLQPPPSAPVKNTKPRPLPERKADRVTPSLPAPVKPMIPGSQSSAARKRRGQAQQQFWMQIGGGAALFVVVLGVWHFGSPARIPVYEQPETPNTNQSVPTAVQSYGATNDKPKAPKSKSNSTPDSLTTNNSTVPLDTDDNMGATVSKKETADETAATPSPTLTLVRGGIFAVYAQHSDQEHAFRIGTAWAATRRQLVTTGAIAMGVEELQRQGLNIVVSNPANERPILIKNIQVNPAYKTAVERANVAKQQIAAEPAASPSKKSSGSSEPTPQVQLVQAYADQARFDLGLLEVATGERLKSTLNMDASWSPDISTSEFKLIGFPFPSDEYGRPSAVTSDEPQERRCPTGGTRRSEKELTLAMEFPKNVSEQNWSGSPVFNATHRVIGIYSRPASSSKGQATSPQHAIIWLGRLREFAPEFDN